MTLDSVHALSDLAAGPVRLATMEDLTRIVSSPEKVLQVPYEYWASDLDPILAPFSIALHVPADLGSPRTLGPFDEVSDNFLSLLHAVCEVLADDPRVEFEVRGFGQDPWPVDVGSDLVWALEELPALVARLRGGEVAVLELLEQGTQRSLTFVPDGAMVRVTCWSLTAWQPDPATVVMPAEVVIAMLDEVVRRFVALVRVAFPSIAIHPWFVAWCDR